MRTIAIVNLKGGVGKTATTVNVAAILAKDYGQRVLVIDADSQCNTTEFFGGDPRLGNLADVLRFKGTEEFSPLMYAVGCIQESNFERVSLLVGDDSLMDLDLTQVRTFGVQANILRQLVERIGDKKIDLFDWCLVDCPPAFNAASAAALIAADEVIIPIKLDAFSLRGMANIELIGLQQPLRVRPNTEVDGDYIIISGHRRYTALRQLVKEGQTRFQTVPCIVERSSAQSSAVEQQMQELRLIYANSDTRRMTSAEISKQAERVEMLLYELKKAGVKFPGKMRDHVAEACKVSASKLARLKVIRENLIEELKAVWEDGAMSENVAYLCAKLSADTQRELIAISKECLYLQKPEEWYDRLVETRVRWLDNASRPECERGSCVHAQARTIYLARNAGGGSVNCAFGKCCSGCNRISGCPQACPHLADEIKHTQEEKKALEAERLATKEQRDRPVIDQITALWTRFFEAREAAGLPKEHFAEQMNIKLTDNEWLLWTSYEQGEQITASSSLLYLGKTYGALAVLNALCQAADILGVSVDYLLGRTKEGEN